MRVPQFFPGKKPPVEPPVEPPGRGSDSRPKKIHDLVALLNEAFIDLGQATAPRPRRCRQPEAPQIRSKMKKNWKNYERTIFWKIWRHLLFNGHLNGKFICKWRILHCHVCQREVPISLLGDVHGDDSDI